MAIVTGDRYLSHLVRFVSRRAGALLDGTLTLKLNPAGLHYVASRLDALGELELLLAAAPVDYLRAYVSDLGDHRALESLRRILRLLPSLTLSSSLPRSRDPSPLHLLPFARLRVLHLRSCDLSSSPARGMLQLRHTLEKLVCHDSTDALRHVFACRIEEIGESGVWEKLKFVACAVNGLVVMDESLKLLPVVETLDLSRNRFARVDNLRGCVKLRFLDLGFNQLRTIGCLSSVSCPIVRLVLRNNALTTLNGLQNLKSLEGLDLSHNLISSFSELEVLASLPCLQDLWLEGNPVCCARWYRAHVFSFFSHPEKLKLDEQKISTREYWERHFIFTKRQKQSACYGFYFPAKDDAEDEGCLNMKKKHSRLANIEDDEQRTYIGPDVIYPETVLFDHELPRKDENTLLEGDSEIVGLMNKVEYMKKEQPIYWLREFKEWFSQNSNDKVDGSHCLDFSSGPLTERYLKQWEGQGYLGESSVEVPDISADGNEHFATNDKGISEIPVLNGDYTRGVSSEQAQLKVHSKFLQDVSPLEVNVPSNLTSITGEVSSQIKVSPTPFTAIDEIIGSRSSSLCPGSPPYYQRDILNRRLYLEEEFLQLSAGSLSVASSDSDTSCSEDDSCRFHMSTPELDPMLIKNFSEQGSGDHSDAVPYHFNRHEVHEDTCLNEDSGDPAHARMECLSPNRGKSCLPSDYLSDHSCEIDQDVRQDVGVIEKPRSKRKPKKRVVSLVENSVERNTRVVPLVENSVERNTRVVPLVENSVELNTEVESVSSNARLDIDEAAMDTKWNTGINENYARYSYEHATIIESHNWQAKTPHTNDAHNSLLKSKPEILIMN